MKSESSPDRPGLFSTTHWSLVIEAGDLSSPSARSALEELCQTYWYPLYAFARGLGRSPESAEDLVQSFFAQLIEKNALQVADRNRGRFRTFLLTSFKRFTNKAWSKDSAQKRGGGEMPVSLDHVVGEKRLGDELSAGTAPDHEYEKRWAVTLIENARSRLEQEFVAKGKGDRFLALEPHLAGEPSAATYAEIAGRFGLTEGGVKAEAYRFRQRYRNHLRAEVAKTVVAPEEIDEEIAYLMDILSR